MIRALNSIYTQAHIPQTDSEKRSFAGYVLVLCQFIQHHHDAVRPTILKTHDRKRFFGFLNVKGECLVL
jgi:hypothetical protein